MPILPEIARAANIHTVPAVVVILSIAAALQRIIAIPQVDRWLRENAFLSTTPPGDTQANDLDPILDERGKNEQKD